MTSVLLPEGELRVARCDMLDKLIAVGDGDAALLYLYILRHGGTDGSAAARALRLSADRYERAAFTLNNLIAPMEKPNQQPTNPPKRRATPAMSCAAPVWTTRPSPAFVTQQRALQAAH